MSPEPWIGICLFGLVALFIAAVVIHEEWR